MDSGNHSAQAIDLLTLQAKAARSYGVPWSEFDYLTPWELRLIAEDALEEWRNKQLANDNMMAQIAACVMRAAGAKHVRLETFLPDYHKKNKKRMNRSKAQTPEEMAAVLSLLR